MQCIIVSGYLLTYTVLSEVYAVYHSQCITVSVYLYEAVSTCLYLHIEYGASINEYAGVSAYICKYVST